MSEKKSRGTGRTRSWTFILYPTEGEPPAPENWRDVLDEEHIQWIESPLHDKDTNPDGTLKKPHIHILLIFESVKDYEQIKIITDKLNAPIPQKCNGAKGLVRYMAHLDNPEKVQYLTSEIIGHGGVDVSELLKPTSSERYQLIAEMMDFVQEHGIVEMEDLLMYARREKFEDWFPLLCDNSAYIMGAMIKSRRHRSDQSVRFVKVDENGEVI